MSLLWTVSYPSYGLKIRPARALAGKPGVTRKHPQWEVWKLAW